MRSAAQVLPIALAVEADRFTGRNRADDFRLVVLADFLEVLDREIARQHAAVHGKILRRDFGHARLDGREIVGRKWPLIGKIVVKAVFDDRTDRDLGFRKQLLNRICEQMRRRVADDFDAVGILVGHDTDLGVVVDEVRGIDEHAVDSARKRSLRKPWTDACGDAPDGDGPIKVFLASVGKRDYRHRLRIIPKGPHPFRRGGPHSRGGAR